MRILFLVHRIPYPPDKGDKIRSFNELKYLSTRHDIFLGTTLDQESEQSYQIQLRKYCKEIHFSYLNRKTRLLNSGFSNKPFSISYFYDKGLQRFVDKTLNKKEIDVIFCFCSSMAEYLFRSPYLKNRFTSNLEPQTSNLNHPSLIMDYVDLDSDKWRQYAEHTRFPLSLIYRAENKRLFKYEIKINQLFHHSIFVSQREADLFKKLYPEAKNVRVIPNGVDYEYFSPKALSLKPSALTRKTPVLVFTGMMDYFANIDGVKWFTEKIFPIIRSSIEGTRFYIVGNRPTKKVKNLAKHAGVTVTGYVEDIGEYYRMADTCVVPLRIARGLQNKVLEAMATGNAVVATSNASEGIVCQNNVDIVIADDEKTFADEVINLLKNDSRKKELGAKAVENIRQNYSWEKNLKALDELLQVA